MKPIETEHMRFIQEALIGAADIAKHNFGKVVSIETKDFDNNQVLTETDLEIGKFIVQCIQETYPTHNIINEESGVIDKLPRAKSPRYCSKSLHERSKVTQELGSMYSLAPHPRTDSPRYSASEYKQSEYTWVIDPIDGTSNFASGVSTFGIIIGLIHKDRAVAGGVALPMFSEIYVAEKGKGAYCNGQRMSVTKEKNLKSVLVGYSIDGHQEDPKITRDECEILAEIVLGCRNLRTSGSAFDAMMVAKGNYGAYHHRNTKIWDVVGIQAIIEEAGGLFTDFFGNPIDYTNHVQKIQKELTTKFPFCTAAPELHRQLQEIIHKERH